MKKINLEWLMSLFIGVVVLILCDTTQVYGVDAPGGNMSAKRCTWRPRVVKLTWRRPAGEVSGFTVKRDNEEIASLAADSVEYSDLNAPRTACTYSLTVVSGGTSKKTVSVTVFPVTAFLCGTGNMMTRKADSSVDIEKHVSEMVDVNANVFLYSFVRPTDWADFPGFLEYARSNKINVIANLTLYYGNKKGRPPYYLDWEDWFSNIAALSLSHPNLIGISGDDFGYNLLHAGLGASTPTNHIFTAHRLAGLRKLIDSINPDFALLPLLYYPQISKATAADMYREYFDGAIFPYRRESLGEKELKTSYQLTNEMNTVNRLWGENFPVYVMFYASPHSSAGNTTVEYIQEVLEYTKQTTAGGVFCFRHSEITNRSNPKFEVFKAFFAKMTAAEQR